MVKPVALFAFFVSFAFILLVTMFLFASGIDIAYPILAILFFLLLGAGLLKSELFPITTTMGIPLAARLIAGTLAPTHQSTQAIIITSVLFALGASFAYPIIKNGAHIPDVRRITPLLAAAVFGIAIGLIAAKVNGIAPYGISPFFVRVFFIVYVALAEELAFRGAILESMRGRVHPVIAVTVTSMLYASLYLSVNPLVFLVAYTASIISSFLYLREGKLWPSILFTLLWKLVSFGG